MSVTRMIEFVLVSTLVSASSFAAAQPPYLPASISAGNITTVVNVNTFGLAAPCNSYGCAYGLGVTPVGLAIDGSGNLYYLEVLPSAAVQIEMVSASTGYVTIVAGGSSGCTGLTADGAQATGACIRPTKLAVDSAGHVYFDDYGPYAQPYIRTIDQNGNLKTLAGNGNPPGPGTITDAGDGGAAINAALSAVSALAVDGSGSIYISTQSRVRRIDTFGNISTVAGTGNFVNSGAIESGTPATSANLATVTDMACDGAGFVYLLDRGGRVVRKVDPVQNLITTVAGTGVANTALPFGDGGAATSATIKASAIASDAAGNLYIGDVYVGDTDPNQTITHPGLRRVDVTSGVINTVVDINHYKGQTYYFDNNTPGANASVLNFSGVKTYGQGIIYYSDDQDKKIRQFDLGALPTYVPITISVPAGTPAIVVDGTTISATQTLQWQTGTQHSLYAFSPVLNPQTGGARLRFSNWSDGATRNSYGVTTPSVPTTYSATYVQQYLLLSGVSTPTNLGTLQVQPLSQANDGFYDTGTQVQFTAAPALSGVNFQDFTYVQSLATSIPASQFLISTQNPLTLSMTAPTSVLAEFNVPEFNIALNGTSGSQPNGVVGFNFTNNGQATAKNVMIKGVTFKTLVGSGSVTLKPTAFPMLYGDISVGQSGPVSLSVNWPSTVRRFQVNVAMEVTDTINRVYDFTLSFALPF